MIDSSYVTIRIRRDTSDNWFINNPILKIGEPGLEIDTRKLKFGDGITTWNDLPYTIADFASLIDGKVPSSQLPSYVDDALEFPNLSEFPAVGETSKIYVALDNNKTYRWSGSIYVEISASPGSSDSVPEGSINLYYTNSRASAAAPVQSVSGKIGTIILSKNDVGLANVDNTSDANKPVSIAQALADSAVQNAAATDAESKANAAQSYAIQRSNHTGTQTASTISDFNSVASAASPVQSVAGRTGDIVLSSVDISDLQDSIISNISSNVFNAAVSWTSNHTLVDGTRYLAGDLVYLNGKIYRAKFDNESMPVTNTTYWEDLGSGYRLNIDGRDIPNIPYPVTSVNGSTGDVTIPNFTLPSANQGDILTYSNGEWTPATPPIFGFFIDGGNAQGDSSALIDCGAA